MNARHRRIRNTGFYVMLAGAVAGLLAPEGWPGVPGRLSGMPRLVVMLLTSRDDSGGRPRAGAQGGLTCAVAGTSLS